MYRHRPGADLMLAFKLLAVFSCVVVGITAACGQSQDITTDSRPTAEQISVWLESGDARHIAWGAYFARETGDDSLTPAMVRLLEQWQPGFPHSDAAAWSRLGISYVLDSLISLNRRVTLRAVATVRSSFPTEAIILVAKMPEVEAGPLLLDWYRERSTNSNSAYPRIAAMMLSKSPPPGFAASVLNELTVNLEINVVSPNHGFGGSGASMSCGDGGAGAPRQGWPPQFVYVLEENSPSAGEVKLVDAGGDLITYRRISSSAGWGSCFGPRQLTSDPRFDLIAEMLGKAPREIAWQPHQSTPLVWKSDEQYLHDSREIIAGQESRFRSTVLVLRAKGYLGKSESARPQLKVAISDHRETVNSPLPHLALNDAGILESYSRNDSNPAMQPQMRKGQKQILRSPPPN
jgi:hypothetical protein